MGDVRYGPYYQRLAESADPATTVRALDDAQVVAALAAASRERDPLVANVLATEAMNRMRRATAVAESVAEGVLAVDTAGRIMYANAAAQRLLGVERSEMLARPAQEVVEVLDAEGRLLLPEERPMAQALRGSIVSRDDVMLRVPGGDAFPGSCVASPIHFQEEVVGAVVTFQDVTERRSYMSQLRASEERFRRLYDESPAMHFTVDQGGVIRSANRRAAELLGFDVLELVGRPLMEIVHPDDRAAAQREFFRALRGEPGDVVELRKLRKDGEALWAHEVASATGDGDVLLVCQDATHVKQVEQEMQRLLRTKVESELRQESLVRYHPDVVYGLDVQGRFTDFNPAAERVLGYSREEVLGKSFAPLVAPEDLPRARANFARVLAGEVHENTYTVVRKDGSRHALRLVGIPAVVDGRVVGSFGIAKAADPDEGLAARWRRLVEALPDPGIVTLDPAGYILSWNRGAEALTGWSSEEARGRHIGITYSREAQDAGGAEEPLRRAFTEGRVDDEGWRVRKDGTTFWARETVVAIRDEVGVLQGFANSLRRGADPADPAAEARARQQAVVAQLGVLALRGVDLRSLVDLAVKSAADTLGVEFAALAETRADGQAFDVVAEVGWGKAARETISATPDSFMGFTLVHDGPVVMRDVRKETRFTVHPVLGGNDIRAGMSVVIPGRPTERAYGVFTVHTAREREFGQDDVNFLQAIGNVVASALHRVRSEADLREANRDLEGRIRSRTQELSERNLELEAFSYTASHDLRAPLRGITYLSRMLRDELGPRLSSAEREDLDRLGGESERLTKLVNDLLALSRVGAASLDPEDVDLTRLAEDVMRELRAGEPREIEFVVQPGLSAHADPDLVRALLVNLLGNAVKYTRRTDAARVEFGRDEDGFCVRDNGIGFDPDHADRLFVAFNRLHGNEFEGTGIGLATVRRIVERHGGRVRASSPGIGLGATFRFTLPPPKGEA